MKTKSSWASPHLPIHQVGLGLYVANMFKAMKSASMQQEADFVKAGNPGLFQSTPNLKVTHDNWDRIQLLDVRTLLCTHVVKGSGVTLTCSNAL